MTRLAIVCLLACGVLSVGRAQVLPPEGIKDPKLRALQSTHLPALTAAASAIVSRDYPSKFYLARALDLSAHDLESADQRSVEFTVFEKQTVLLVMGNYAAVYPTTMPPKERVIQTYLDVAVPIANAVMPVLRDEPAADAVVIELSHHVHRFAVVNIDRFENAIFVLPRAAALKLAESRDPGQQLAALGEAKVYIDGKVARFTGQLKPPAPVVTQVVTTQAPPARESAPVATAMPPAAPVPPPAPAHKPEAPAKAAPAPSQTDWQPVFDKMLAELGTQAQFDPAAKLEITSFRAASYLRLPVVTTLAAADGGSQYRVAALAFDRHVSHLIRLVLPYLKNAPPVDGVAFRATVHAGSSVPAESVEFLFPMAELRRYESYDITGQQLINAGVVLINGERAGLDLQSSENTKP